MRGARGAGADGRGRDLPGEGLRRRPPRTLRHAPPRHRPGQDGRQATKFAHAGLNTYQGSYQWFEDWCGKWRCVSFIVLV